MEAEAAYYSGQSSVIMKGSETAEADTMAEWAALWAKALTTAVAKIDHGKAKQAKEAKDKDLQEEPDLMTCIKALPPAATFFGLAPGSKSNTIVDVKEEAKGSEKRKAGGEEDQAAAEVELPSFAEIYQLIELHRSQAQIDNMEKNPAMISASAGEVINVQRQIEINLLKHATHLGQIEKTC